MIGQTLAHYRITAAIGTGGMGKVYRATDTKLGREVALKVLPADMAAHPERLDRFRREARALAALDHPGIVTVYSVEEHDGVHFLTMQLVEGQPLDRLIPGTGLPLDQTLAIATALAEALAVAHDKGIVHRDLKPQNVMVTKEGRVKVLDFGLAKMGGAEASFNSALATEARTKDGVVMGTVPYMSPEQVQGRELDHRTDIFSLGVILYEMATGRRPFRGDSSAGLMSAILRDTPPPAASIRTELPSDLQRAITACLQKEPAARPQSARDLFRARPSQPAEAGRVEAPGIPAVVVLPFVNRSPDPGNEYFSDGLTEEVITDLAGIEALRVISRNSAMALKGTTRDTPSIAKELNVTHVVSGSVRMAGDALRVTVELIDASTDAPVWSEKYSGTIADVFGIQEEISRRIVTALKLRLTSSEERQITARPIEDMRAYDCYLRARQEMYRWTPESLQRAETLVRSAIEIVGENALLLATEGHIHWTYVNSGISPDESRLIRAEECARRALALDPESYQAVFVRGIVAGLRGRLEDAVHDLVAAYRRNPGDANVLTELSRFTFNAGQMEVQELTARALTRIDPFMPVAWICEVVVHTGRGRFADAAAVARHLMTLLDPYSLMWIWTPWQALVPAGERAEARDILAQYATRAPSDTYRALARFLVAAIDGDAASARQHMTPAVGLAASSQEHFARVLAEAYAQLGQTDDAVRWLRGSADRGMIHYPFFTHDVLLDPIRHDPRFQELMTSIKRRWEAFPRVTLA